MQGSAHFPCQGPDSKDFQLCGPFPAAPPVGLGLPVVQGSLASENRLQAGFGSWAVVCRPLHQQIVWEAMR